MALPPDPAARPVPESHRVINAHYKKLVVILTSICRRKGLREDVGKDIAHSVFEKILKFDDSYIRSIRDVLAFILRIGFNELNDYSKKHSQSAPHLPFDDDSVVRAANLAYLDEYRGDSLLNTNVALIYRYFEMYLTTLSPVSKAIIRAYIIDGHPIKQIATDLDCDPDTVRRYIDQAIDELYRRSSN